MKSGSFCYCGNYSDSEMAHNGKKIPLMRTQSVSYVVLNLDILMVEEANMETVKITAHF